MCAFIHKLDVWLHRQKKSLTWIHQALVSEMMLSEAVILALDSKLAFCISDTNLQYIFKDQWF